MIDAVSEHNDIPDVVVPCDGVIPVTRYRCARISVDLSELSFSGFYNVVRGEAEALLELLEWCGRPERLHAQLFACGADVTVPAQGGCFLDGHSGGDLGGRTRSRYFFG